MRLHNICVALILTLSLTPCAAADDSDPAAATRAFYDVYLRAHVSGVPSARQQKAFERVISQRLAGLMQRAASAEARHFKLTRNHEPPLAEGDVFTSLFEGADRYRVGECTVSGDRAECSVELTYRGQRTGDQQTWKDRVLLVRERQRWAVDDIAYGGTWDFGNKGKLGDALEAIASWQP